jgi:hypothetical protein
MRIFAGRTSVALAVEGVVLAGLLTVALDVRAHARVERLGGVNVWGYRGPVMAQRRPHEIRLATVGGDLAFGWGVAAQETAVQVVRQLVALEFDRPGGVATTVTAVNLGAIGLAPGGYSAWVDRFGYLRPDVIAIVADSRGKVHAGATEQPDRRSLAFALFGYAPMLPLVLEEKGALSRSAWLGGVGAAVKSADHLLARLVIHRESDGEAASTSTPAYVSSIERAVRAALDGGAAVVVVAPPYFEGDEVADHEKLSTMISSQFSGRPVRFVDLGNEPGMYEEDCWLSDRILSAAGHSRMGESITPAVLDLLRRRVVSTDAGNSAR